ncbi:MAG: hypothetical protein EA366_00650 [Spirulina sp. DLM2.Bin59]|nr:MAG: hypothetical protein EA366_00650 [Spirulina sp. DLM2.Bin59]
MAEIFTWGVIPIPIIIFQTLALLFSIAIEAYIFSRQLLLTHRECVQYSAAINLLSAIAVWLFGFTMQAFLPPKFKLQLISYIFLGRFYNIENETLFNFVIVLLLLFLFFLVCFVEFKGLDFLEIIFSEWPELNTPEERQEFRQRLVAAVTYTDPEKVTAIFWANAASNSAILLVILIAVLQYYT